MNRFTIAFAFVLAAFSAIATSAQVNPAGPACVAPGIACGVSFEQSLLAVGAGPSSLVSADFNRDGVLDLAVVNANNNTVSILLGKGAGTFAPAVNYTVNLNSNSVCITTCGAVAIAIAVGDFNGDGIPDLAITNIPINTGCSLNSLFSNGLCSSVAILLGNGDGTFQPADQVGLNGQLPTSVAVGDVNNDGKQDLVITNLLSNNVEVLLGNGDGTFKEALNSPFAAGVGNQPASVAIGDFNHDGFLDLAVANSSDGTISNLQGNGDGTFFQQPFQPTIAVGVRPVFVGTVDVLGTGGIDLVVANLSSSTVSVLITNGDGTFAAPATYGVGGYPASIAVGDFNSDGKPDLAIVNRLSNSVSILINIGSGFFQIAKAVPVGQNPQSVAVGDYNGDGIPDLAVANATSNNVSVLLNEGIATTPRLTPNGINFGNLLFGTSTTGTIVVENTGTARYDFFSILIMPDGGTTQGTFTEIASPSNDCQGRSIGSLISCNITISFAPGAIGTYGATLILADNTTGGSTTARLTGAGVAPFPIATLTLIQNGSFNSSFNNTVQFVTIEQGGSGSPATIVVQNTGSANLVMGSLSIDATTGNAGDIITSGDTCSGATIPVFSSCEINLTFAPTSAPGTADTLILSMPDNAPNTPQQITLNASSGPPPAPPTSVPVLASVNDDVPPVPANGGSGTTVVHSAVSSGGQYVAFESSATNLPGGPPGIDSIYLRTICLQETGCAPITNFISYGPTSGPNANGGAPCNSNGDYIGAARPAIDTTGQFVAFLSDACMPTNGDEVVQIYLRNVAGQSTGLISLDDNGNPLNNGMSAFSMSANARYFAYSSSSGSVGGLPSTNFTGEIYLRDANCAPQTTGCTATTLISQETNGSPVPESGTATLGSMSPDGRYVVFMSADQHMVASPPSFVKNPSALEVYLRDTCIGASGACTPTTTAISVDSTGNAVSGDTAAVANGGRFVTFAASAASLLPSGLTSASLQVYLADTCTYYGVAVSGCTTAAPRLISIDQNGNPDFFLYLGNSFGPPTMTPDGRLTLFTSYSPLLANVVAQAIYAYDTCTSNGVPVTTPCNNGLHLISVDSNGAAFGKESDFASVDATGQYVSFGTGGDLATVQNPMSGGVYLESATGATGPIGPTYTIGGTVTGLSSGASVALLDNGGGSQTVTANGAFTFTTSLSSGAPYNVTVGTQPAGETCTITSGSGTVAAANVASVLVACVTSTYTIGVSVSGLTAGNQVTMADNGNNTLTSLENGSFTFSTALPSGASYNVIVSLQPTGETCTVSNGTGTVAAANVTNVTVACEVPTIQIVPAPSNPVTIDAATDGSDDYIVSFTVTNQGNATANLVSISAPKLGVAAALSTPAINSLTKLAPGASGTFTITFPATAGSAGAKVAFSATGTYTGGTLSGSWSFSARAIFTLP
jgi:hypothetical protein